MGQLEEVWKLTLSTHPPVDWIAGIEIFSRKFKIVFKFVGRAPLFSAILICEGFLRRALYKCSWGRCRRC
jgi:hypothetical protein